MRMKHLGCVVVGMMTVALGCAQSGANRTDALRLLEWGYALRSEGDQMGAARAFAAAVRADPRFGRAHLELGLQYLRGGRVLGYVGGELEKAEAAFRTALDCDPSLWEARQYLVVALAEGGRIEEALVLQKALALSVADRPEVHNNLGDLLLRVRSWSQAEASFRTALELQPDYPLALGGLGTALWRGGRIRDGITALRAAVAALPPDHTVLGLELARALSAEGLHGEADAQARRVLKVEPENPLVYHVLAEIHAAHGDKEAAAAYAREAMVRGSALSPELRDQLGMPGAGQNRGGTR